MSQYTSYSIYQTFIIFFIPGYQYSDFTAATVSKCDVPGTVLFGGGLGVIPMRKTQRIVDFICGKGKLPQHTRGVSMLRSSACVNVKNWEALQTERKHSVHHQS